MILAAAVLAGCSDFRRSVESSTPPPNRNVSVNYKGPDGFNLAVRKADEWCDERFGESDVHLVKDDRTAGRATFVCQPQ
jgi:hypothetical protein